MTHRRFAKDEMEDVAEVIRSYPWWLGGHLPMQVAVWICEWALPEDWWAARDRHRTERGLPL